MRKSAKRIEVPDRTKTLNELDRPAWGEPTYDSSLVTTCHRLRNKPLREFSVGDLRIMIGQCINLELLLPLALDVLEKDPLAEGSYYPGDLFENVIVATQERCAQDSRARKRLLGIVAQLLSEMPAENDDFAKAPPTFITQLAQRALARLSEQARANNRS